MSESKHTSAPWTVEYGNDTGPNDGYFVEFYEVGPALIRYIDTDKEEMKANAHLIAAAPELLEALELINKLVCDAQEILQIYLVPGDTRIQSEEQAINGLLGLFDGEQQRIAQGKTKAAIAKAKGESK